MPKKISIYTAFGQFIEMIESTKNVEQTVEDTDRYLFDLFTMSDYQQNVFGIKNLQIQTCPTVLNDMADYSICDIRKVRSCPIFSELPVLSKKWQIPMALSSTDSSYHLNMMTPSMLQYWQDIPTNKTWQIPMALPSTSEIYQDIQSPIPTTIESRKLNEITPDMISFWKVHVTTRPKKSAAAAVETNIMEQISTDYFVPTPINPSIFEKLNGVFDKTVISPTASFYRDLQRMFEENPSVFTQGKSPIPPSIFENFNHYFSPKEEEYEEECVIGPLERNATKNHSLNCLCWKCWRMQAYTRTESTGFFTDVPTLPVFVKSPVDSLRLYKCSKRHDDVEEMEIATENVSTSGNHADVEDNISSRASASEASSEASSGASSECSSECSSQCSSNSSASSNSSTLEFFVRENELLNAKTQVQKTIIKKFMKLLDIDDELIRLRDE